MERRADQAGYTFVEMMIAMTVAVIVGIGIYGILAYQRRATESQRIHNELQVGCRYAMDHLKRELSLAGYRAQNTARPVSVADENGIAFEYWDEHATADAPFDDTHFDRHSLVSFRLDGSNLVRTLRRWDTLSNSYQPGSANMSEAAVRSDFAALNAPYRQTLASNVDGFELRYFNQDNELWDRDFDSFDEIRSVVVALRCRAAEANPFLKNPAVGSSGDKYAVVRLQSHVRLRNVDISTNPRDTQPPGTPTNVRAWDPGICGSLALAWDANRESDLAGYTIYHGLATGSYSNRIRLARSPGSAGDRVSHTLTGLESSKTDCVAGTVTPVTYFVRVEAFDKSGNPSARSAEVSGNPSPSIATEAETAAAANDTSINPTVPPAPTGLIAATPADNQVQLSWAPSDVVGLVGYRLYRGSAANFTPAGRRVGDPGSNIIADETTLTANAIVGDPPAVRYLDTGLNGCVPVHYKLAAIACDPCGAQAFAAVSATPTDTGKPTAPKLVARAGFKRVILSLENPVRTEEPDFKETRVYFNAGSGACTFPFFDEEGALRGGRLIPDNGGIFSGEGTLASVNFDDADIPDPSVPNLAIDSSYCFLAVSYDQCNNHSDAADDAKDVGQQCGDCLSGEPCYDAPGAPATTDITTAGCYGSLELSWPHLDPTGTAVRDFAGYRVYRCENSSASPCSSESKLGADARWRLLTGPEPVWFSRFVDSPDKGLEEGRRYSYRVQATDCYWEQHHGETAPEGGWPEGNDPNDNASDSALLEALSTGRILRDPARPIVLAGMTPNADWTQYPVSEEFQHHTVLLRLKNSADATLSLKQATLEWETAAALLQRVALGDNSTTPLTAEAWLDSATTLTQASGGVISFVPEGAVVLHGLDDAIPVHLTFKREDGGVSDSVNLRENQMQIGIGYRNDSTGDGSCTTLEKVQVPLGPYISGTTQNWPHQGTVASPVPGTGGQNPMNIILVPGEQSVDVHTTVLDADLAGIREVRLYYTVDSGKTLAAAPLLDAGARYGALLDSLPPYHGIEMERVAGSQWRTPAGGGIPANNDANVWYFIVAVDENGNFDREPEPGSGAFQYYQQPHDVCLNVPGPPALTGSVSSTTVTLSWTGPALNTNGSSFTDPGGFAVYRWSATRGPVRLATLDEGTRDFIDSPPGMDTETYAYYVTALDSCANPGANESVPSNWFTECQGAAGCTIRIATHQSDPSFFQAGDRFSLDLSVCEKIDGQAGESLFVQICSGTDANIVTLVESADTGTYRIDSGSEVTTWHSKPGSAGPLDLGVGADDTVSVHAWSSSAPSGGCGSLAQCAASLRVQADPCATVPVPATPSLTVAVNGAPGTCGDAVVVDLAWTGPEPGAALFYRLYRCSNADSKADCVPIADGGKVLPVGAEPDRGQTGRSAVDSPGVKADRNHIWYQVEAVSHNGCATRGLWQTTISAPVVDDCP